MQNNKLYGATFMNRLGIFAFGVDQARQLVCLAMPSISIQFDAFVNPFIFRSLSKLQTSVHSKESVDIIHLERQQLEKTVRIPSLIEAKL